MAPKKAWSICCQPCSENLIIPRTPQCFICSFKMFNLLFSLFLIYLQMNFFWTHYWRELFVCLSKLDSWHHFVSLFRCLKIFRTVRILLLLPLPSSASFLLLFYLCNYYLFFAWFSNNWFRLGVMGVYSDVLTGRRFTHTSSTYTKVFTL